MRGVCVAARWLLGYDPDEQKMVGGLTLPVLMSDVKIRNKALRLTCN